MRIFYDGRNTMIENVCDFDLSQTLECGQCFRFYKQKENDYVIVAKEHMLHLLQKEDTLIFFDTKKEDVENVWIKYFDLDRDYAKIKERLLMKDDVLFPAIKEKNGVRILNQEFHEVLLSFIISQNKQIPHIKKIVRDISESYGKYLGEINGEKYYSFPDIEAISKITEDDYRKLKTGFRASYLKDASEKLVSGAIKEDDFKNLSEEEARKKLMSIKGVGEKVANCVLLFSLGYREAFPVDVWIKRIMESLYFDGNASKEEIQKFAKEQYGEYGGYAQQYLFCFGRDHKLGTAKEK